MVARLEDGASVGKQVGAVRLLFSRRFGPLFLVQFLSAFNDNALKSALVLMIAYHAAGGERTAQILVPLASFLFILPFFLMSATAGQIADENDKARVIRLIKSAEIPVMLAAAAGVMCGSQMVLLALLAAMGVAAAFFGPLKYAILPDLLAPGELLLGNALVEAGTFVAILLGTIAGVAIASAHGAAIVALLIVAVAIAAWGAALFVPATGAAAPPGGTSWNLPVATWRIMREAAADPVPFRAILAISWFWLAGATYLAQFPAYIRFTIGASEAVVTLFLVVFTLGIAIGSMASNRLLSGRISARIVPWGALGIGLFSLDLWLASPAPATGPLLSLGDFLMAGRDWRLLGDLLGIAVSGGVFIVPLYALLQATTARRRRAQAVGANNVVNALAMVISAVAAMAWLAVGLGVPRLFALTGLLTIAVGAWCRRLAPRFDAAVSS
jgi:acyl-[acyl-carrier-protein]-phospholipid O-acyltransferase / long-chain-fatty-acid--[acyl-carrier-protein] ligase